VLRPTLAVVLIAIVAVTDALLVVHVAIAVPAVVGRPVIASGVVDVACAVVAGLVAMTSTPMAPVMCCIELRHIADVMRTMDVEYDVSEIMRQRSTQMHLEAGPELVCRLGGRGSEDKGGGEPAEQGSCVGTSCVMTVSVGVELHEVASRFAGSSRLQ